MSIIGWGTLGSKRKYWHDSDTNPILQYATLGLLPLHLSRWEQSMYYRYPVRGRYIGASSKLQNPFNGSALSENLIQSALRCVQFGQAISHPEQLTEGN